MAQSLFITKAGRENIFSVTDLINNAYRGNTANLGWTSENEYMEGQRATEADIERLFGQLGMENFKCCTPGGEIVGFVSLEKRTEFIYLSLLTVSPKAQAGGIGKRLLEFAESYAKSILTPAILITVVNVRSELIAWYERRGYYATGKTAPFPDGAGNPKVPVHLIEMKKEISI